MAENTQLNVSSLEFDDIKKNLKSFLRDSDRVMDYDFDGSSMSVFLDVMAYTTHYMGFHANMAINESFLDTAVLRNSVVSHAKNLGYIPTSAKGANAIINLTFNMTGIDAPNYIVIERGTGFTSTVQGATIPFVTLETFNIFPDETGDFSGEIEVFQGTIEELEWSYDANSEVQKFFIEDIKCDRSTLQLTVNEVPWTKNKSLSDIDSSSLVYFTQEGLDNVTEIYFGDAMFGKSPQHNEIVRVSYLRTSGSLGNYTSTIRDQGFNLNTAIGGLFDESRTIITTVSISSNGSEFETVDSIRHNAPKSYERQDRAVTASDYKAILLEKYPNIDSIAVWGGEDNDPPQYGAVFISIKPKYGLELSPLAKEKIKTDILSEFNILAVNPLIVLPEYTFVDITSEVKYYSTKTSKSSSEVQTAITNNIIAFFDSNLGKFNASLHYSHLTGLIDDSDVSINSNLTTIKFSKKFYIQTSNTTGNYIFKFSNAIVPGSVVSSLFGSSVAGTSMALLDDGQGNVLLYDTVNRGFINTSIGTVDYENGIIQLIGFNPSIDTSTSISLGCKPLTNDIHTLRNNIIILNNTNITMTAV
jgi:hypothetical protein